MLSILRAASTEALKCPAARGSEPSHTGAPAPTSQTHARPARRRHKRVISPEVTHATDRVHCAHTHTHTTRTALVAAKGSLHDTPPLRWRRRLRPDTESGPEVAAGYRCRPWRGRSKRDGRAQRRALDELVDEEMGDGITAGRR